MDEVEFLDYTPGAIGRVVELHARYYYENWSFGQFFEVKVATELSEFFSRYDPERDAFWSACLGRRVEGSIVIDGIKAQTEGAHLRWFILTPELHGLGLGNRLMEKAMGFCRRRDYARVYLWTFEGLLPARHLYEKFGFRLAEQHEGTQWGKRVNEQKFLLD
jgi:GNAT superfamily N-acetyltransferase